MKKIFSFLTGIRSLGRVVAMFLVFSMAANNAHARIIFSDDTLQEVNSQSITLDSNGAGANNTFVTFGADSTASENGVINWNVSTNTFEFDHGVSVTGGATVSGTTTLNGAATIGDGGDDIAINSNDWDISSAGVGSGFTGFTSTGTVDFSGATRLALQQGAANPGTCTEGDIFYNTTDNTTYICTATNTFTALSSGGTPNFETIYAGDNSLTTSNGIFTITTGTNDFVVDSNDWNVTAAGALDAATITSNGLLTGSLGATISGAATSINASSNFATNINTGTSTGAVSIGGGSGTVAVNSTSWDISTAGAASGFTTIDASGNITTSAGTFCVGTTCLNETTSATDSGAFLVGAFDEFTNSNSTNVQDILDDLDALIGSNAPNADQLTFYPEFPDAVVFQDGSNNAGTLSSDYDDTNDEHYYDWRSNNATTQDIDIKIRYALPADFSSTGDFTYRYQTGSTTEADNDVEIRVYNATDETAGNPTECGNDTTNGSTTWATGTITAATLNTGCTGGTALNAGDIVEVDIRLTDNSGGADFARIGFLNHAYNN